jgi:hypothetical protein
MPEPNKPYQELLKDPRWQKKRLEIMQKADFRCSECGSEKSTLNIHHGYYEKGKNPWEYSNSTLHCLCDDCHEERGKYEGFIKRLFSTLSLDKIERIVGYSIALYLKPGEIKSWTRNMRLGQCDACGIRHLCKKEDNINSIECIS